MGGTYTKIGDYYIPNLILSPEKEHRSIGIWGQRHRDYLKQHNQVTFDIMLRYGTLFSYLAHINELATDMFSLLVDEMAKCEGVNKKLKGGNQMEWVTRMNNICNGAMGVVNADLIFNV
ncbi:MAG: TnpV protein [Oscillospiraceae bacterium]|nr:TnpV protein [Oscillospiraceae bacterium]